MARNNKSKSKSKSNKNGSRKMKLWKQVGCASTKSLGQKGGKGFAEFSSKTLPPLPNALIGPPWSIGVEGNYYKLNNYVNDFIMRPILEGSQIKYGGGRAKSLRKRMSERMKRSRKITRSRKRNQKGGNAFYKLAPSDLLNAGRYITTNAGNFYNGVSGYPAAVSPLPWNQPNLKTSLNNLKL